MKNSRFTYPPVSTNGRGRALPAAAMELLRQATAKAEMELSRAPEGNDTPGIRKAKKIAEIAEANWQEAWDASQRMPGIIQPRELQRLRIAAEVGWLHLDKTFADEVHSALKRSKSELEQLCQKFVELQSFRVRAVSS